MGIFLFTFITGVTGGFVMGRMIFCIGGTEVLLGLRGSLGSRLGSCELRDRPSGVGSDILV